MTRQVPRLLRDHLPRASALSVVARSTTGVARQVAPMIEDMTIHELRDLVTLLAMFTDSHALLRESIDKPLDPVEHAIHACAARFDVTAADIVSPTRTQAAVEARQVVCYIAHRLFGVSSVQVGRAINRDHTTVLFAVGRVGESARLRKIASDLARSIGWQRPPDDDEAAS